MKSFMLFAIVQVSLAPPSNLILPSFTGLLQVGETLTRVPGIWSGGPSLTWEWFREGGISLSANVNTYTIVEADLGFGIYLVEHDSISGTDATSDLSAPVTENAPANSFLTPDSTQFFVSPDGTQYFAQP